MQMGLMASISHLSEQTRDDITAPSGIVARATAILYQGLRRCNPT